MPSQHRNFHFELNTVLRMLSGDPDATEQKIMIFAFFLKRQKQV